MANNTAMVENTTGGFGSLVVGVFFTGLGTPAEGATVTITDPNTNAIIEEVQTNGLGRIPVTSLPTPPLEYSLNPNNPRPFNQYNVSVTLANYQDVLIKNVQIFPSATSLQYVALTPEFSEVIIPYPTLWGDYPAKIPESEIKDVPMASSFVVLPEPVVPSIIVVHGGKPDDATAPNYIVTFKNYIKNVASSEIYSTWPREAIKANVLAIISFTLNRVYTEWYRGKGYNFVITNSTAYDQSYSHLRNIYQQISEVVDELFTTYITKPNIRQPLFTQYCDGFRIKREGWLSQWGSKDLAEKGYTAIQILKNYYGFDIILKQAKKVEGIPLSFTKVLKIGSTGSDVKTIQNQLNVISNSYPLMPKVKEDGVYTESTANSVKVFQEIFRLPITGEVNFPTWYRISDVFVAVSKLA